MPLKWLWQIPFLTLFGFETWNLFQNLEFRYENWVLFKASLRFDTTVLPKSSFMYLPASIIIKPLKGSQRKEVTIFILKQVKAYNLLVLLGVAMHITAWDQLFWGDETLKCGFEIIYDIWRDRLFSECIILDYRYKYSCCEQIFLSADFFLPVQMDETIDKDVPLILTARYFWILGRHPP